jgi:hypothetical protein
MLNGLNPLGTDAAIIECARSLNSLCGQDVFAMDLNFGLSTTIAAVELALRSPSAEKIFF